MKQLLEINLIQTGNDSFVGNKGFICEKNINEDSKKMETCSPLTENSCKVTEMHTLDITRV